MKTNFIYLMPVYILLAFSLSSCEKEPPSISEIDAEVNEYTVNFSAVVTDASSYLWDFGDNNTSTQDAPVHTYEMSGTYTVTLTVTGDGGETTSTIDVEILPSFVEMLTGGPDATSGKTWILSKSYTEGVNGGGIIDNNMWVMLPTAENVLTLIGLGDEYDNEFTFYHDGQYVVDVKNGEALTAGMYGVAHGNITNQGNEHNDLGLVATLYENPESATWTLNEDDLVVNAIANPLEPGSGVAERTITGKKWVSLSEDAFFGILDFPSTRKFIVKEITPDKIEVALLVCLYWDDWELREVPTFLFHLTYVPKP
ncbi:MAG: PKD domain-containing protein [Bacteroidales bacterium]